MNKRNEMRKAEGIAGSARNLLGPLPATRVLRDHLMTIIGWKDQGASWDQIAALLRDAGWRSKKGDIVSAHTLRAIVSRIRRSEQSSLPETAASASAPMPLSVSQQPAQKVEAASVPVGGGGRNEIAERIQRAASLRHGRGH